MANRRRHRSDDPPLFEDLELEEPQDDEATSEQSGLDRLVTRVSARPTGWSMKWRPDESKSPADAESDRHPARSGGSGDEPRIPSTSASEHMPETEPEPEAASAEAPHRPLEVTPPTVTPATVTPADITPDTRASDAAAAERRADDSVPSTTPEPVLTSRTWKADDEVESRHPRTPGVASTASAASAGSTRPPATSAASRSAPVVRARSPIGRAGWPIAALIAIAWIGSSVGSSLRSGDRTQAPTTPLAESAAAPVLARPSDAELIEAELLRSELASMREERARLVEEVDAAYVLLQDHRRLSSELQESMAANRGGSIEVDALAEDLQRWRRRHRVAVERLDEMDQELVRSDARVEALLAEIEALHLRLETRLDDSPGND